ncbi:unnamed protein product [Effrenium voratum]|uniref:Uncharacterized protein n=2 Tax=Effrenium voratum TaxID=2562239 RepID=A0AA36I9S7_9DINO|nr:unnamed protein product [Effrenium voratum]CAJ1416997.1 unnamed protein product [Effrenium voratum]
MGATESCQRCCGRDWELLEDGGGRRPLYPTSEVSEPLSVRGPVVDPRQLLADFLCAGDDRGPGGFLQQQALLKRADGDDTKWFAVFRPTSVDAINKMMDGSGTGKGLNVKGKSAKSGRLSGFVPVLQISENRHKAQVCTSPPEARVRIYFPREEMCTSVLLRMRKALDDMSRVARAASERLQLHKAGKRPLTDEEEAKAFKDLLMEVEDDSMHVLQLYSPEAWGLDVPERVFREVYITRGNIIRDGDWKTGRPSEPAFMDMNLYTLRDASAAPRAVMWQLDVEDGLNPLSLLMAYEEDKVKPVVSDFDAFMLGCSGAMSFEKLPEEQVKVMKWTLQRIEEVLSTPSKSGWMSRWLEILKRESDKGFHPEIPRFGFGDPTSYRIVEQLVTAMGLLGAVRHGAECFNYYFPQDLDDEFLVVWRDFETEQPWKYLTEPELRGFLLDRISDGYSFPLNPKWVICDKGWREVFLKLRAAPQFKKHLDAWFPHSSGLMHHIDELCRRFPNGFETPEGAEQLDFDLAELQLRRYEALQRAKRKLKVCLRWMKLNKGSTTLANPESQSQEQDLKQVEVVPVEVKRVTPEKKPPKVVEAEEKKKQSCLCCFGGKAK